MNSGLYTLILLWLIAHRALTQDVVDDVVTYTISYPHEVKAGETLTIQATFNVKNGWYIYAPDGINTSLGKMETTVLFHLSGLITKQGKLIIPDPVSKEGHQVYTGNNIVMKQRFNVPDDAKPGVYEMKGRVTYQSCNSDVCLPPETYDWHVTVNVTSKQNKPIRFSFTSVDGRQIDLAALKGKVVLIDCWATWCAPCIKMMPQIRELYDKYHSKGLEIIGISMDYAAAHDRVMNMITSKGMIWPQYFEARGFKQNSFRSAQNISVLPALMLLDTDGNLVHRDAHGDQLEVLIRKHLGIQ